MNSFLTISTRVKLTQSQKLFNFVETIQHDADGALYCIRRRWRRRDTMRWLKFYQGCFFNYRPMYSAYLFYFFFFFLRPTRDDDTMAWRRPHYCDSLEITLNCLRIIFDRIFVLLSGLPLKWMKNYL